jgi:hypothetical protein
MAAGAAGRRHRHPCRRRRPAHAGDGPRLAGHLAAVGGAGGRFQRRLALRALHAAGFRYRQAAPRAVARRHDRLPAARRRPRQPAAAGGAAAARLGLPVRRRAGDAASASHRAADRRRCRRRRFARPRGRPKRPGQGDDRRLPALAGGGVGPRYARQPHDAGDGALAALPGAGALDRRADELPLPDPVDGPPRRLPAPRAPRPGLPDALRLRHAQAGHVPQRRLGRRPWPRGRSAGWCRCRPGTG